jgi:hypothetical protein
MFIRPACEWNRRVSGHSFIGRPGKSFKKFWGILISEYVEFLKEVFEQFGQIQPRRMFGGYGIFYKGLMFGLVAEDVLYLKGDEPASN